MFYSIDSATGSSLSTQAYAAGSWPGVCLLGASISALALAFWGLTLRFMPEQATAAQ